MVIVLPGGLHFDGDDYPVLVLVDDKRDYFDWHPLPVGQLVSVPQGCYPATGTFGCNHATDALPCGSQLLLDHVRRARLLHVWQPEICKLKVDFQSSTF